MISKFLEKKVDLLTKDNELELKNPIYLEYFLVESHGSHCDGAEGKKAYGIEIVKSDGKGNYESEMVKNIYNCRESTRSLLDKLAENTVTPVCLLEILDDMIGV